MIKNVKNTVPWKYVISDLKGEEIVGTVCKKDLLETNQKEFRVENLKKRKLYGNGIGSIVLLINRLMKKTLI